MHTMWAVHPLQPPGSAQGQPVSHEAHHLPALQEGGALPADGSECCITGYQPQLIYSVFVLSQDHIRHKCQVVEHLCPNGCNPTKKMKIVDVRESFRVCVCVFRKLPVPL